MNIGQVVYFRDERFFDGAVQLGWLQRRIAQAREAAAAFVFHGPRYHGSGEAEREGIEGAYRLKDTASFVRDLLDSMLAGAAGREANPYWLAVAGYGSGKSHLALTCGALLSEPAGETARLVLEQIAHADGAIGETVARQVAALAKPVLVLPLDGMAGFHLGNALSRAVFAQLERHGVDAGAIRDLSPRFRAAEQFVERNFAVRADRFAALLPDLDRQAISDRLRGNDEDVYAAVDTLYTEANGHPIPVEGQESAQELIDTLCNVYCAPDGHFSHVLILFDELGRYLEYAAEKPQLAGDAALQQIFQGVQDNSAKVRFVGFIQYELKAYLKRFGAADLRQLQRYVTRFDAADKWYLSTNLETIFAHMIGKDEAALAELWRRSDAERASQLTWRKLSQSLPGFSRYPVWSDPERFAQVIARGCWPLHPLAVWFLTRQRDLVQSRSALTFIKDAIQAIAGDAVQRDGRLRYVSAADLAIRFMLPELVSAERETGGGVAETLQTLLERFKGHLDEPRQAVLAGIAVLEKARIGKQTRETADSLLGEATALDPASLPEILHALSELGAVEWNGELGQYELLSDGATRGQFQQWLRAQQAALQSDGIRDLFVRRGAADCGLGDIVPDFAHSREISTPDWFFESRLAHANTVENVVEAAFREWQQATLPKEAKGRAIYLYLHPDDDVSLVGERVQARLAAELSRIGQTRAPIWVIGIADRRSTLRLHLARLHLFDERLSEGDQERFRRFVPDERERSRTVLKEAVAEAVQERLYWIAGIEQAPSGRLRAAAHEIFCQVYPEALPFPFDGFASSSGGGAADAVALARGLIAGQVNGPWVQAQPMRLQNRVDAVLIQSWKALLPSGKVVPPAQPRVRALLDRLEQAHRSDPQRALLTSYRQAIAPPYGLNASSAALLIGLLLGLGSPPRRLEESGTLVSFADWLGRAFAVQRGRQQIDESVLEKTRVRFLSEDSEGRWRALLNRWEAEQSYAEMVKLAREAARMCEVDPLPESLEGNYKYLRDAADRAAGKMLELENALGEWERGIERAQLKESVEHAIKLGSQVLRQRTEIQGSPHWPARYAAACDELLALAVEQIRREVGDWIKRQNCTSAAKIAEFRSRTEKDAERLAELGFRSEAQALTQQAHQSIYKVEKLQRFDLTLAKCNDYPRQPEPTESTLVRVLRDDIALGDDLVKAIQGATEALSPVEIAAYIAPIRQRQERLQAAVKRHQGALAALYGLQLDSREAVQEALTKANRLRDLFVETRDAREVGDVAIQLERILADAASWEIGAVAVERLEELLMYQADLQLSATLAFLESKEIEPAWDCAAIYRALANECLDAARRRSLEWSQPRLALASEVETFDRRRCEWLERELSAVPAYVAATHAAQLAQLLESVQRRALRLDELERRAAIAEWEKPYFQLGALDGLDQYRIEQLLHGLRNPPQEMRADERERLAPIAARLTAKLDQLGLDELMARIERLSQAQQRRLLARLSELLGSLAKGTAES